MDNIKGVVYHKVPKKGLYARVGDFFGPIRPTQQAALNSLMEQLEAYHPLEHKYIRCGDGTVLHLCQTPSHGWNVYIIPPTGYTGQGVGLQETFTNAVKKAEVLAKEKFGGVVG